MNANNQNPCKKVTIGDIIYLINEEKKTAGVGGSISESKEILIPYSIIYGTQEYVITSILNSSFKNLEIKSIQFPTNSQIHTFEKESFSNSMIESIQIPSHVKLIGERSFFECIHLQRVEILNESELQTIDKEAFYHTLIDNFTIPSQIVELKKRWCVGLLNFTSINVSPENPYFKTYNEGKFIIGKTKLDSMIFDRLFFCVRNIKTVLIPDFIKCICSYAFNECNKIQRIEFSNESNLETIESEAFINSSI